MTSYNSKILFEGLQECLTNIKAPGSYAQSEPLESAPNPGLYLNNGGTIGLPLSDRDAEALIAASHQAPFGKGEQTIVDETVRKTWQLSVNEFQLKNPAWIPFLQSIVTKVSAGLGVDATGRGVTAELYKLLLYDKGAMFKPHQDSEKAPGMFGTLVIILPSKHDGGEVHVTHAGQAMVFQSSSCSDFDCSYAAWFSDVTHEVKPVRSGRRLVLTYNLMHTSLGSRELGANLNVSLVKLNRLFSVWKTEIDMDQRDGHPMYWLLEHEYTDESLSYDSLKGQDQLVCTYLRDACKNHGFSLYLASLERVEEGGWDDFGDERYSYGKHKIEDLESEELSLQRVVTLNGSHVASDIDIEMKEFFINKNPFEDMEADDEEVEYTGNEGVRATLTYNSTVVVILPKSERIKYLVAPTSKDFEGYGSEPVAPERMKIKLWLEQLVKELRQDALDRTAQKEFTELAKLVVDNMTSWRARLGYRPSSVPTRVQTLIVAMAVEFDRRDILLDMVKICAGMVSSELFQSIGTALLRFDLQQVLPEISAQIATVSKFSDRILVTRAMRAGLESESQRTGVNMSIYQIWLDSEVNQAILTISLLNDEDGSILASIAKGMPSQVVFDKILPAVKRNSCQTPFAMAFMAGYMAACANGEIPESVAQSIFKDVLCDMTEGFTLQSLLEPYMVKKIATVSGPVIRHGYPNTNPVVPTTEAIPDIDPQNIQNLSDIFLSCYKLGLHSELERITDKIEYNDISTSLLLRVYLPALGMLVKNAEEQHISLGGPVLQRLFFLILSNHVASYVRYEPLQPRDWARSPVRCTNNCNDCALYNQFLMNPVQQHWSFKATLARMNHIEWDQCRRRNFDIECRLEGKPKVLYMTKTQHKFYTDHANWTQRCAVVRQQLYDIGPALQWILGDKYQLISSLAVAELLPQINQATPLGQSRDASNRMPPPITKRKIPNTSEVIVLD